VSLVKGAVKPPSPDPVGLGAIRRPVQIATGLWPFLPQSWPNAADRGWTPGAVDVSCSRCCARAPVRASHPNKFAAQLNYPPKPSGSQETAGGIYVLF
jgi:hypothetical protein